MKTTNDLIIEAIDNIEADEFPTTPENRKLFTAERLALEAITE